MGKKVCVNGILPRLKENRSCENCGFILDCIQLFKKEKVTIVVWLWGLFNLLLEKGKNRGMGSIFHMLYKLKRDRIQGMHFKNYFGKYSREVFRKIIL